MNTSHCLFSARYQAVVYGHCPIPHSVDDLQHGRISGPRFHHEMVVTSQRMDFPSHRAWSGSRELLMHLI